MIVETHPDDAVSRIATAIGEPARTRMLYCLLDGHARTSTELAMVAEVSPSTASVHLNRLKEERLVAMVVQGKHRYYRLAGPNVASALEGLSVLAGGHKANFVPNTPSRLRAARTCYDHIAGALGVSLHDRFHALGWLWNVKGEDLRYEISAAGGKALEAAGVDVAAARASRRQVAYGCLDWSERKPHLAGALGAAILDVALKRKWILQDLEGRALDVTSLGKRELLKRFDVHS